MATSTSHDEAASEAALRSDIYVLSTLLTSTNQSNRVDLSTARHPLKDKQLEFWRNLAFLLSTGTSTPGRNTRSRVVAVTGNVEIAADGYTIAAAVVARNDSRALPSNLNGEVEAISEAQIPCIVPIHVQHNAAKARELLEDPKKDIEFENHVRDVFIILLHCLTLSPDKRPRNLPHFTLFTAIRTYRKLVSRLCVGPQTWGTNPIRIIHRRWSSTPLPPESSWLGNQSLHIKEPTVRRILSTNGVPQASDENTFLLNANTAEKWVQVLLNALQDMEAQTGLTAIVGVGDDDDKYEISPAPLDDRVRLLEAILVLEQFVSSNALAHLLTRSVAEDLHTRYEKHATKLGNENPSAETQSRDESSAEPGTSEGSVDDDNNSEDMIDEDDAASITSTEESKPGDVQIDCLDRTLSIAVIRYVSSLAFSLSASRAIFRYLFRSFHDSATEVSVSMVTLTGSPRIDVNRDWIDQTQQRLTKTLYLNDTQAEKLRTLLDEKLKHPLLVTVHAEAALMGAAVQVAEGKLTFDVLQTTPQNRHNIRIGVPMKCCLCCALLGEELRWWDGGWESTISYPRFVLPGHHGTILSWYPPPGIPTKVLRNMAGRLERILETELRAPTSPTISDDDDFIMLPTKILSRPHV